MWMMWGWKVWKGGRWGGTTKPSALNLSDSAYLAETNNLAEFYVASLHVKYDSELSNWLE